MDDKKIGQDLFENDKGLLDGYLRSNNFDVICTKLFDLNERYGFQSFISYVECLEKLFIADNKDVDRTFLDIFSANPNYSLSLSLFSYFYIKEKKELIREFFKKEYGFFGLRMTMFFPDLQEYIGSVDPDYYFDYVNSKDNDRYALLYLRNDKKYIENVVKKLRYIFKEDDLAYLLFLDKNHLQIDLDDIYKKCKALCEDESLINSTTRRFMSKFLIYLVIKMSKNCDKRIMSNTLNLLSKKERDRANIILERDSDKISLKDLSFFELHFFFDEIKEMYSSNELDVNLKGMLKRYDGNSFSADVYLIMKLLLAVDYSFNKEYKKEVILSVSIKKVRAYFLTFLFSDTENKR